MLLLAALVAVPGCTLVLLGAVRHQPVLQAAGVLAGTATGVLLCWWGGRLAARRLTDRGAELMDLFLVGPPATTRGDHAGPPRAPEVQLPGWKSAAVGVLWTVGIVCVVPRGWSPSASTCSASTPGQGLVRRPLPAAAAAGPGGGRLHRRRRAGDVVGLLHRARSRRAALMPVPSP
jgi:hypothetical protein